MADPSRGHAESVGARADDAALRIAFVLATSTGGVGRHVRAAASGLVGLGHQVAVFGPAATDRTFGFSAFAEGGRRAVRFRPVEIASGLRPIAFLRAARRLRHFTRNADVVHAHGLRAGVVTALALGRSRGRWRSAGVPSRRPAFVVTLHNAMLGSRPRRRLLGVVMRGLARRSDLALAVSGDLASQVGSTRSRVERALVAARLAAPIVEASAVRAVLQVPLGAPMILAVGRLHRQKGFDVLVEAASLLTKDVPDVVTIVAGEGPQRAELERLISAARADVRLLGDRADVANLVAAADVVVMPSRWEGWPLAAAEVLGAGRPFVATRVGGLPELVADAAVLVESDDPRALAATLSRLLTDPGQAAELASKAVRRAAELPTDDDVSAQLLSCYQRVLGRRR